MLTWFFQTGRTLIDLLGRALGVVGLGPLPLLPTAIVARARRRTALESLGHQPWPDGLARGCKSYEDDAGLGLFGRIVARQVLGRMAANRLRYIEARRRHPEVFVRPLPQTTFVLGLPRSGTTLLQRLLSTAEHTRGVPIWEAREPVHLGDGPDRRRAAMARDIRLMRWLAPELDRKHAFELDTPEECLPLFDAAGGWNPMLWRPAGCTGYLDWLLAQDATPAFAVYADLLRWIVRDQPDARLVLKTPNFVGFLPSLLAAVPGATVFQTHRDPAVVIPSYLSLQETMYRLSGATTDRHRLGLASLEMWAELVERGMAARAAMAQDTVVDVAYEDLRADPIGTAVAACEAAGRPCSPTTIATMQTELAGRAQHRHGNHHYDLADYGLSREQVHERFASYIDRHLPTLAC